MRADDPNLPYLRTIARLGKTNSIAWTPHFLANLHDAEHQKMFDSVLVVSDRNVLDAQSALKREAG